MEKDEVLQDDKKIATKNFSTLYINENSSIINQNFQNVNDPVDRAIQMYKYHPSIILIIKKVDDQNKFSFESIALSDAAKEIKDINPNKSSFRDSIPPKMLEISSKATVNI